MAKGLPIKPIGAKSEPLDGSRSTHDFILGVNSIDYEHWPNGLIGVDSKPALERWFFGEALKNHNGIKYCQHSFGIHTIILITWHFMIWKLILPDGTISCHPFVVHVKPD